MAVTALLIYFSSSQCPKKNTLNIARYVSKRTLVFKTQSAAKRFRYTVLFPFFIRKYHITDMLAAIPWANKNTQTVKILSSAFVVTIRNP